MSTNEDAARAMVAHGSQEDRTLGEFWLRCGLLDREAVERCFVPEFSKWRRVLHYQALEREAQKLKEVA